MVLDTFVFADPQRTLELNPPESERLLDLIRRVALGKTDGQRLLRSHNGFLLLSGLLCKIAQARKIVLDFLKGGKNSLLVSCNGCVICSLGSLHLRSTATEI